MRRASRTVAPLAALLVGLLPAATGCATAGEGDETTVTVFAAASLTEVFGEIATRFEETHPGRRLVLHFAGSSTLAAQINEGAPADVFAAANSATMAKVSDAGHTVGTPTIFARNELVIAVAAGNPHGIDGLADLAAADLKVALCAEQVPCGSAAQAALAAAGVSLTPVTLEPDVRATLAKLTLGEVDAALVYRTDVTGDDLAWVWFPESAAAINEYPIAVLAGAANPEAAHAFMAYVRSDAGTAELAAAGFRPP